MTTRPTDEEISVLIDDVASYSAMAAYATSGNERASHYKGLEKAKQKLRDAWLAERQEGRGRVPDGWKFTVSDGYGSTWLHIYTPDGSSAALSCQTLTANGGETIPSQVLHYFQDTLSAAPAPNGKKEG